MEKKKPTIEDIRKADELLKHRRGMKMAIDRRRILRLAFAPYPIDDYLQEQAKKRRRQRRNAAKKRKRRKK